MPKLAERHAAELAETAVETFLADSDVHSVVQSMNDLVDSVTDLLCKLQDRPVSFKLVNIPILRCLEIQVSIVKPGDSRG